MERALLAKVGSFLLAGALIAPASLSARAQASTSLLASGPDEVTALSIAQRAVGAADLPEVQLRIAGRGSATSPAIGTPAPTLEPPVTNGVALASWYGPGFYGGRTACGQIFSDEIVGVAHRTLPCGTTVRITSPAGVTVVARVIDRGPFVAGRSLDLSFATKNALQCTDLCWVRMAVIE